MMTFPEYSEPVSLDKLKLVNKIIYGGSVTCYILEKIWLFVNPDQMTKFTCSEDCPHVEEYYQGMKSLNIIHRMMLTEQNKFITGYHQWA